jgi:hypothetical protein
MTPKSAAVYAEEIKALYQEVLAHPEDEKLKESLNRKVGYWEKLLDITIFQAQNEQLGWSEKELCYPVRPMLLKGKETAYQVADYQAYYSSHGCSGYVGILVERKGGKGGAEDIYSTLINSDNCSRFYREIDRFREDPRFTQMVVIAECSFEAFLLYKPPFIGKQRNTEHIGASVEARRAKIASLQIRGISVIFCGTRHNAIATYRQLIRQWILKNYVSILSLDSQPYDDKAALTARLAREEAAVAATRAALGVQA